MSKFRRALPDLLVYIFWGLLFYGLSLLPVLSFEQNLRLTTIFTAAAAFMPLLLFLLRETIKSFPVFALLHIFTGIALIAAGIILSGKLNISIAFAAYVFLLTVYCLITRFGSNTPLLSLPVIIAAAAGNLTASIIMSQMFFIDIASLYAAFTGASFLIYILYEQVTNVNDTVLSAEDSSGQYTKWLLRFNNRIIAVFLALAAIVLIFFGNIPVIGNALWQMLSAIKNGIIWLISLIPISETVPEEIIPESPPQGTPNFGELFGETETKEPLIPTEVYIAIVLTLLLIGVIYLFIRFISKLNSNFNRTRNLANDTVEYIGPKDLKEKEKGTSPLRRLFSRTLRQDNKTRREFYKRVRSYYKKHRLYIEPCETARDITDKMTQETDAEDLGKKYEKARYGPND